MLFPKNIGSHLSLDETAFSNGDLYTILTNKNILNYFDNRSTNASAESFNAKIKAFRAQFRGVKNIGFFLFRLTTIFA